MAKQTINNKESTLLVRNKINSNFTELYDYDSLHVHGNITNDGKIGTNSNLPLITTTAGVVTTGTFGTAASTFCEGNDPRLSDSRTPTSHSHGNITNDGKIGTNSNLPLITTTAGVVTTGTFGTAASTFCEGNDPRLSNSRTPTSHSHGNITNAGTIGSTANLPLITTTAGVVTTGTFGTAANTFAAGNHTHTSAATTFKISNSHTDGATAGYSTIVKFNPTTKDGSLYKGGNVEFLNGITSGKCDGVVGPGEPVIKTLWNEINYAYITGQDPSAPTNFVYAARKEDIIFSGIRANGTAEFRGNIFAGRANDVYNKTEAFVSAYYDADNYTFIRGSNTADTALVFDSRVNNVIYAAIRANGTAEFRNSIYAGRANNVYNKTEAFVGAYYDADNYTFIRGSNLADTALVFDSRVNNVIYAAIRANGTAEFRGNIYAGRSNSVYNGTEAFVGAYYDADNYTFIRGSNIADTAHVFNTRVNNVTYAAIRADGYIYSKPLGGTGTRSIYANADGIIVDTSSDERLKENISPINNALAKVKALKGVYYNWKNKEEMGAGKCIGLIAQEVQKVVPEAVFQSPTTGNYGVNYAELVSVLINAINELAEKIEANQ